jgi:hypothetical protein
MNHLCILMIHWDFVSIPMHDIQERMSAASTGKVGRGMQDRGRPVMVKEVLLSLCFLFLLPDHT